jgi:hypothetical protein
MVGGELEVDPHPKTLSTPAIRQQTRPSDSLRLTGTRWAAFPCMRRLRARLRCTQCTVQSRDARMRRVSVTVSK